jgi:L-histidine N-alpha-methyltransferase
MRAGPLKSSAGPAARLQRVDAGMGRERDDFARDVRVGLTSAPKRLACRYFYDDEGSRLFDEICDLPEYYLTRAEREVLSSHAIELASMTAPGVVLVELGSGSAVKTRLIIEALLARHGVLRYVPVDVSRSALDDSAKALLARYPELEIEMVAAEYGDGLQHLRGYAGQPKLVLWLGSNIGNLTREEAIAFLNDVRSLVSAGDRLLIGVDLRKERAVLERAYDDERGVTAAFNLNLLTRINRELGGHFDLAHFRHRAVYDEDQGRIEMYLVSDRSQIVTIDALGLEVPFAAGEMIHTENSYKYSPEEIDALAAATGFVVDHRWLDSGRRFSANVLTTIA